MKTEEEIGKERTRLQKLINQSLDASELGEDITGIGTELSNKVLSITVGQRQILDWVLETEE